MAELVVAFDTASGCEALALAERLPALKWAKLGSLLYVREGPAVVQEFRARGVQVFLDLKWHDIPSVVAGAVTAARDLGVAMATVHCLGGSAMLAAAVQAAGELALVGVTVLTSHDAAGFEQVVGRGVPDLGLETERLARLALHAGLRGKDVWPERLRPVVRSVHRGQLHLRPAQRPVRRRRRAAGERRRPGRRR